MADVRNQHDAVARRDAEQRDEPDHRGHIQHAAGEEDTRHAADQRQRQVDHDQQRIARPAERQHQQHEQARDDQHAERQQPLRRALLALELAAVLDAIARPASAPPARPPSRMSSTTLPRSRPATLHEITMRRWTFSRSTMFGPCSRRTSASSRTGTDGAGRRVDRQIARCDRSRRCSPDRTSRADRRPCRDRRSGRRWRRQSWFRSLRRRRPAAVRSGRSPAG